ncbi:hypothetical protein ABIA44_008003 [Bradyrhizobium sp. USDA 329]
MALADGPRACAKVGYQGRSGLDLVPANFSPFDPFGTFKGRQYWLGERTNLNGWGSLSRAQVRRCL